MVKYEIQYPWVPQRVVLEQTGLSRSTLTRWRNKPGAMAQGIHYTQTPAIKSSRNVVYNLQLIRSLMANDCDTNSPGHQRAIEAYLKSLPGVV
jgi:hypothetical protein